jgi:molybdopterin-containing oxidoreductase family membrane subunit
MATLARDVPKSRVFARINADILRTLEPPTRVWYAMMAIVLIVLGCGIVALIYQIRTGLGVTGYANSVYWAVYITNFVFWVGIAHSGTLISAILFLFRSRWRTTVYRVSEMMTVFAVMTAGLFPLIHLGRIWKFYYLLPYPNNREIYPDFQSPLIWDTFAVGTYFTISSTFLFMGLVPDIAAARDTAQPGTFRHRLWSALSLGWQGTDREWKHFNRGYLFLAAFATPLVLSVHSVVSWDFASALVPGWHSTIFAPYFVAGAIFSGVAMVITLVVPMRKWFGLEEYLNENTFDNMAKLIVLTSTIVTYAYLVEFFLAWYSGSPFEKGTFWDRVAGPYWWAGWIMLICNSVIPLVCWSRRVRRSITAMFVVSIFINIGMWFERFVIIVQSLQHDFLPSAWGPYRGPTWVEYSITAGSFAWFLMYFLIAIKFLPSISVNEVKEMPPEPLVEKLR